MGGMAEVFRAKPLGAPDPNKYFAVKRILPHLAEDVEFIKMFVDEARLTVQLRHPNIVQTYELGQFQSSHYIAMEFIAGKDLLAFQKLVRRQNTVLDIDMACHIMREVARGIDHAHKATDERGQPLGIIHRDISPQNVLVSWDGKVRVIDFGVAKAASQSSKTQAGVLKGKFGYMSPEQVKAKNIDHRSDIFSMGTLFWELITNRRLFKAGNQYETMMMIGDPDIDPPSLMNPAIPSEIDAICMKALAEDRDQRYQTAGEFADALHGYLMSQKPPYHRSQLTTWLRSAFREDFEEEKEKREEFRAINSADDVRRYLAGTLGQGGPDPDQATEDATQIWDVDEAPDTNVDIDAFVSNHTVVAAGGLDLSDYEEFADAPDTIDETQDVVESRIEAVTGQPIEVLRDSVRDESYEEATVVAGPSSVMPTHRPGGPPQVRGPQKRISANDQDTGSGEFPTISPAALTAAPTPPQGVQALKASDDLPTPVPVGASPKGPSFADRLRGATGGTRNRIILAAAALMTVGSLATASIFVLGGDDGQEEVVDIAPGRLLVEVTPPSNLEIYLSGEWVGDEAPLRLDDLQPGTYRVEIDHPDHPAWSREVEVGATEVAVLDADLAGPGTLVISWEQNPEDVLLFVNGQPLEGPGNGEAVSVDLARGKHLVEAFADDMRPLRKTVNIEAEQQTVYELTWTPVDELVLLGEENLTVVLDGRTIGELPLTLEGLSRHRVYALKIGDVERVLGFPELGHQTIEFEQFEQFEARDEDDYGGVLIEFDDGQPWELVIDDVATGMVTPFTGEVELPLAKGWRVVGFQRGDERHDYRVRVFAGETTRLRPSM